ncbi:MAG: FeS assembly SUF system protein [Armatimonadota bacterium]
MPEPVPIASDNPINPIERAVLESEVAEAIRTVYDPEIPVNVYDLGLIYDVQISEEKDVHIVMTLTSPACPVAGTLPGEVEVAARAVPWARNVSVELTWDPPFSMDMVSEEVKLEMGWY